MNRFGPAVRERASVLTAAVTSIVLTAVTGLGAVFTVHADQTEWAATATAAPSEPDDQNTVHNRAANPDDYSSH